MRYRKAPILEAALEFRWSSAKSLDTLKSVFTLPAFKDFEGPVDRMQIGASIDLSAGSVSHTQRQVGFEAALQDGSQIVFLEEQSFVFVQRAPYDRWDQFSRQALLLLDVLAPALDLAEFSRVGLRFVNRIDIPSPATGRMNTDNYVTIRFDGPRSDDGIIEEFQMRVVKPTQKQGISYALILATTGSPLPDHAAILLDIDVFTIHPVPTTGAELTRTLNEMRDEKNAIFEACLTDEARGLFGGTEE